MLYLPPRWGHDGVAVGACMTARSAFARPTSPKLAREVLARRGASMDEDDGVTRTAIRAQRRHGRPGASRRRCRRFAREAWRRVLRRPDARCERALGRVAQRAEAARVVRSRRRESGLGRARVRLDRRTRMMYDARHVYINGESIARGARRTG